MFAYSCSNIGSSWKFSGIIQATCCEIGRMPSLVRVQQWLYVLAWDVDSCAAAQRVMNKDTRIFYRFLVNAYPEMLCNIKPEN